MPLSPPAERYAHLREACVRRGLRLTPQREVLIRVLSEAMGHPTADELVRQVREVLPTVSHATVYRNLQELVREGLLRTLDMAGAAVQFEINPDEHHHFVCRKCGQVWDVYLSAVDVRVNRRRTAIDGFRIDRREVQLHGVCAACQ
ncbi:MAG: Fur family transcriptional regulator [Gemmatimonadales bacterium]|nr:transcriptional repressor [Gemmatimonadota bacterium]MCC7132131.1 transcriptional repressor [Gemmatimonadales bacterium]MDX2056160.1 Fur family transcriptional regulator [Gemmatimonadales bacterium]